MHIINAENPSPISNVTTFPNIFDSLQTALGIGSSELHQAAMEMTAEDLPAIKAKLERLTHIVTLMEATPLAA